MADISQIKTLDGTQYNIKDATARGLLNGHSVGKDVPSDAKFTDTTYESKAAASGGTAVSLVTTGEKYTWNNKGTYSKPSDGIPKTDLASAVQTSLGKADSALQSHQTIKQDGVTGATVNRFGTCGTAAGTAAKTVDITTGTFALEAGARVTVKFTNANTAGTPTLNVNSKGAKNIFHKGSQITTGGNKALLAGTVDFVYDGTQWHLIGNYIDTTNAGTITGITMNGASKGTSGVVDLGTVITAHQDISGKADKSATVSTVAWDSTNNKITKTINGTTSDVVTAATILGNLTKSQVTTALGYTPPTTNTWTAMVGATSSANGSVGYVNAVPPKDGYNTKYLRADGSWVVPPDTKNTAGSTDTASKIFLIGATSQAANSQTYSHDTAYVGTDGCLYSGGVKVLTSHQSLSGKLDTSLKGAANGLAELDANGKVPTAQLPSYVDDVLEYTAQSSFPTTGETGKIYVDTTTNKTYRWSGSAYVEISASLALGTTSSTAFRGDYGNSAYAHAVTNKGSAFSSGLYKITTNSEGHVTAATAVAKADITSLGIPGSDTNTHRPIQVNGTQVLGDNTTALNLKAGSNVSITDSSGTVTIAATDTTYSSKAAASGGTDVSLVTTGEKYTWNAKTSNTGTVTKVSTGVGLTGGDVTTTGTIKTKLRSETALTLDSVAATTTTDRVYPVAVDKSGYLAVNVPWQNTTYTLSGLGGVGTVSASGTAPLTLSASKSGTTVTLTGSITAASTSVAGVAKLGASGGAATFEHTHTTSLATDTGTSTVTLAHGGKYKLTAGGTSVIFTMPGSGNTDRYVNSASFADDTTNTAASPVKMTLTRAGSDTNTITANIPKVSASSAGVAPKGAAVSSQNQNTKFLREDGTWAKPSYTTNTNTDTLVKQTVKTDNVEYKILSTISASPTSGNAAEAAYGADFTINPSAKTITSPNFKVTSNVTITYNTTTGCLEIIV